MSMLMTSSTSSLFRTSTFGTVPLSPSMSPQSDDIVMDCPSSPSFYPRDIPSTPTTPGATAGSSRSSFRPPNSAKRTRRNTHAHTDPYPTLLNPRRLSAIPSDRDVEDAYKNMSDYETSGSMSPITKRKLPSRSVLQESRLAPSPQLLSPHTLAPAPSFLAPSVPTTAPKFNATTADDLNESLAQAIRLLSLEKKPESYPSTDASSQGSPHASISTSTSYADDHFFHHHQLSQPQTTLPDPEELLKEIVRNSLQSLHALRLAKAMEHDIRNKRTSMEETGMDVEGGGYASNQDASATAMQVVAYLDQSVSTINSARQYIEFTEETLCDTRDRVRDALMKG
ncbi:hypothetical protein H072_9255 [Dactylellina haptotyla CBS 200.50]|uniref:Uncharacterized protein n=1 Tax=Dactylellina haptotyla (strain CBS 200.50) TaxID=1284197 RepID=S8BD17_DACHA|nr:hypothetical protein H072_9255 [Dactylellina haptotyla CBS 200.50]